MATTTISTPKLKLRRERTFSLKRWRFFLTTLVNKKNQENVPIAANKEKLKIVIKLKLKKFVLLTNADNPDIDAIRVGFEV